MPKSTLNDHDLLIRLDTKVDQLTSDIKALHDGVTMRISGLEARVNTLEKINDEFQPQALMTQVDMNTDWIKGFRLTWRLVLGLFTTASLVIGALLGSLNIFDFLAK